MIVKVYSGVDTDRGTIEWTKEGGFKLDPIDRLKSNILKEPVFLSTKHGLRNIYAKDNPELFMKNLCNHYKSYALRVTEAVDSVEDLGNEDDRD